MDMGKIEKAQNRLDKAWSIYYEVWEDEPELLEAKFAEYQSCALNALITNGNAAKLRKFMDKNS